MPTMVVTATRKTVMDWQNDVRQLRMEPPKHLLFLCVRNSSRSQIAEGLARYLAPVGVKVSSAGTLPAHVRLPAIQTMAEIGIDIRRHRSKSIREIDIESVDTVISLCDGSVCPTLPRDVRRIHWPMPDPSQIEPSRPAFRALRNDLRRRLAAIWAHPTSVRMDPVPETQLV